MSLIPELTRSSADSLDQIILAVANAKADNNATATIAAMAYLRAMILGESPGSRDDVFIAMVR
jgi:hypothetical protein